jgi:hypothetical protein
MRDQRDPGVIGAEIIRLVDTGWQPLVAAATVCPSLPEQPPEQPPANPLLQSRPGIPEVIWGREPPGGEAL